MEQITVYDILSWADYTLIQDLGGGGGDFNGNLLYSFLSTPPPYTHTLILFKCFLTSLSFWPHTCNFVKLIPRLFDNIEFTYHSFSQSLWDLNNLFSHLSRIFMIYSTQDKSLCWVFKTSSFLESFAFVHHFLLGISFSSFPLKVKNESRFQLFSTPWTIQTMGFSRSEYWSG